jgi:hypothetical protein
MKTFFLLIALIALTLSLKAQIHTPRQIPPLDKFTGRWVFKKGDSLFTLVLENKKTPVRNTYINVLVGNYKLTVKNIDIVNTLNDTTQRIHHGTYFDVANNDIIDTNTIHLLLYDVITDNKGYATISIEKNNPNKIRWLERSVGGIYRAKHTHKFCLLNNVILIKQ